MRPSESTIVKLNATFLTVSKIFSLIRTLINKNLQLFKAQKSSPTSFFKINTIKKKCNKIKQKLIQRLKFNFQ